MKNLLIALAILVFGMAAPAAAHNLDEYLQATTISLDGDDVDIRLRLNPGVQVLARVMAVIDTDGNGVISPAEERAYGERLRRDLDLTLDGRDAELHIVSIVFPNREDMQAGTGEIRVEFRAALGHDVTADARTLRFANHHLAAFSVYLVNALVPADPATHITAQTRNVDQSDYRLDFTHGGAAPTTGNWLAESGNPSLFRSFFLAGIHHILTGYDHLLFVSALVLAATSWWELVRVIAAFTLAHSITLTLAALNIVDLSPLVVEPLISLSIIVVALQNVFIPERAKGWSRLGAAFFFGLFHGLGFAGGLLDALRDMPGGTLSVALIAFSLGVEAGHQIVVLPLFAMMKMIRRTSPAYSADQAPTHPAQVSLLLMRIRRFGSLGISLAGVYFLGLALTGNA